MRHAVLSLLILTPLVGCHGFGRQAFDAHGDRACQECRADLGSSGRGGLLGALHLRHAQPAPQTGGPPIGAVTYPYYTVRGPRDFLQDQPTSIGP